MKQDYKSTRSARVTHFGAIVRKRHLKYHEVRRCMQGEREKRDANFYGGGGVELRRAIRKRED